MAGIIPDALTGGISWTNLSVVNASRPADPFQISCEYLALPSDCSARIMPDQINAMVSEMLNLAGCFNPDGTWNCEATNNLCANWTSYRTSIDSGVNLWNDMQAHLCANPEVTAANPTGVAFFYCEDGEIKAAPLEIPEPVDPVEPGLSHGIRGAWGKDVPNRTLSETEPPHGLETIVIPNTSGQTIYVVINIRLECEFNIIAAGGGGTYSFSRFTNADGSGGVIMDAHIRLKNVNGGGDPQINAKTAETRTFAIPPGGLAMHFGFEGGSFPANSARVENVSGKVEVYGVYAATFDTF